MPNNYPIDHYARNLYVQASQIMEDGGENLDVHMLDAAFERVYEALVMKPDFVLARTLLKDLFGKKGRLGRANVDYESAMKIVEARSYLIGKTPGSPLIPVALSLVDDVLRRCPRFADAHLLKGEIYEWQGILDMAAREYEVVIELGEVVSKENAQGGKNPFIPSSIKAESSLRFIAMEGKRRWQDTVRGSANAAYASGNKDVDPASGRRNTCGYLQREASGFQWPRKSRKETRYLFGIPLSKAAVIIPAFAGFVAIISTYIFQPSDTKGAKEIPAQSLAAMQEHAMQQREKAVEKGITTFLRMEGASIRAELEKTFVAGEWNALIKKYIEKNLNTIRFGDVNGNGRKKRFRVGEIELKNTPKLERFNIVGRVSEGLQCVSGSGVASFIVTLENAYTNRDFIMELTFLCSSHGTEIVDEKIFWDRDKKNRKLNKRRMSNSKTHTDGKHRKRTANSERNAVPPLSGKGTGSSLCDKGFPRNKGRAGRGVVSRNPKDMNIARPGTPRRILRGRAGRNC